MNVKNQDSVKSPSISMILESTFQNIDNFSENYTFLSGSHERPPTLLDVGCGVGTESICF